MKNMIMKRKMMITKKEKERAQVGTSRDAVSMLFF